MNFTLPKKKEKVVEETLLSEYDRYYRLAFSYVHNEADASDIVQNGAYKAIRASHSLKNIEYAKTWVYRIMLNEIFDFCRKRKFESLDEMEWETGVEDAYENFDLKEAMNALSEQERMIVELKYFEDMKLEEIADMMNINLSTVKSKLYRSMKKLRVELEGDFAVS
ncbi:RNA polymerase sigma-70 factor, ECF subfamily [Lachnospiraceae bacterium XBB1006]|nr:RNA polymerase sigma-70 factor, ECF subfamily [Lachnospiraceae bacterium XBB1006]